MHLNIHAFIYADILMQIHVHDTGQFTTRVRQGISDVQGPGEILVLPGNLVTFSYQDKAPEGNNTLVIKVLNSAVGVLSASPWPALPGAPLSITLIDKDVYDSTSATSENVIRKTLKLNGPSMNVDLVRNGVAGEVELVDDGTHDGRFTGRFANMH